MLTPDEAADIARRYGLTIADAVSLRALADDKASAESIARKFTATAEQKLTARLFAPPERRRRRSEVGPDTTPGQAARDLLGK